MQQTVITKSFRFFPSHNQQTELIELSKIRTEIYNYFVVVQQNEYEKNKKVFSAYDMHGQLTFLKKKKEFEHWNKLNSKASQRVVSELYAGYKSFFKLIKKDKSVKPPGIRNPTCFIPIIYNQSGWNFKENNIVIINKIPLKYKSHFAVENEFIPEIKIKKINNKWLCDVSLYEKEIKTDEYKVKNKVIVLDLGLDKLATGIDSDCNVIVIKNKAKKISQYYSKIINEIKSKQSKKEKYSLSWKHLQKRKKKFYFKKNTQVKHALHIQSKRLLDMDYNTIVVGDLTVKRLMELKKNKYTKTSRLFGQSNISMFVSFLTYKSKQRRRNVVKADERFTTQMNCLTGKLFPKKIELSDRQVELKPGLIIDRDLNSAVNIYNKWLSSHITAVAPSLDNDKLLSVLEENNLFVKKPESAMILS